VKKRKLRAPRWPSVVGRAAKFLVKTQVLTIFLALCVLGVMVGLSTRPDPNRIPYAELFDQMSVVSYRESPSDTSARFVVELAAAGRVFGQYDVDAQRFLPPPRGRDYARTITGTRYRPLRVRGHVGYGFWLDVPRSSGRSLLPEQFDELYQSTLDFVKPVSVATGVLGILSGYSVGYRLGTWNASLASRRVQERVLSSPGLGRTLAREAWRRVLLEPVVMTGENDAARFAAVQGGHRLYAGFFRVALRDSDGFIPREAERLARLGRTTEAGAMLAFTAAVRRAAEDGVHLASADFTAIERWGSLLDRHGHWSTGAMPAAGEERERYLGTLAWYGLAPPAPEVDRVWVGPRMLVRADDAEGFVADEIPATGVGCPISWRSRLAEAHTSATATAGAWFADRPEFPALLVFGARIARGTHAAGRKLAANAAPRIGRGAGGVRTAAAPRSTPPRAALPAVTGGAPMVEPVAAPAPATTTASADSALLRSISYPFRTMGTYANVILVTADSVAGARAAAGAHEALARTDSLMSNWTATSEVARLNREGGSGETPVHPEVAGVIATAMEVWRDSEGAFDITVEPLVKAWGFLGGPRRVPAQAELDSAFTRVGARRLRFDPASRSLGFATAGVRIDLGGIAKGYAVDTAAARLGSLGVRDALVDISGNMIALGRPAHAGPWRIGIRDPRDRMPYLARLAFRAGEAISTSGKYEQFVAADGKTYGHIMDPRTGRPADGLIAVTVVAPSAMLADAWSTALFVLGPAEAKRVAIARADLDAVLIEPGADGIDTVWVESSLRERFEPVAASEGRVRIVYF